MKFLRKLIAMAAPAPAPAIELETIDADDNATAAAGSQEIKTRCIAIMQTDEAIDRRNLAQHLALNTDLPVADALATLLASPQKGETLASQSAGATSTSQGPAESVRAARARQAQAAFSDMMAQHPEYAVAEQKAIDPPTVIERMQANYALARGEKVQS